MTIPKYARAALPRRGFTLIEIMVSLMIFVVVSGAMVSILMMSSELFRRGEFSRSANDETIAVLGAVSDDLNHMVPENSDGWFFAGIPSPSGNTLVAFTTAGQSPDGIGARGQNARSLVGLWVEEIPPQEPRLRRIVLDDSRGILDFISSLVIASGVGGRVITGFDTLSWKSYNSAGADSGLGGGISSASQPEDKEWFGRQIMRGLANNPGAADIEFTGRYNWIAPTGTGAGSSGGGGTENITLIIPSSVLTQGCLHFSSWVALNDIPGMQRPKDQNNQPDWEQLDANGGTRLGPWGPSIISGNQSSEVYDTRPKGWIPPAQNVITLTRKPPFPAAIRLSFVLTGGGRFAPKGILQSDLTDKAIAGELRYSGFNGLPSTPGSMVRVEDEWIAYVKNISGRLEFLAPSPNDGPGRGARRSTPAKHDRGAVMRVGQSYSLVRAIPR
jgi:prepilin-type N-terminal cleavage/methylation domain-containing protein